MKPGDKNKQKHQYFSVWEAFPEGKWYTEVSRFHSLAQSELAKLEQLTLQINDLWPMPLCETLIISADSDTSLKISILAKERDLASDVSRIFSQMAVEAFLNYYGAVRLGQQIYETHFSKCNPKSKVKELLEICNAITLEKEHPILIALKCLTDNRNSLIHANAIESTHADDSKKFTAELPKTAQESVKAMTSFFDEFKTLIPETEHFLPYQLQE